jgi:hypothetical protein
MRDDNQKDYQDGVDAGLIEPVAHEASQRKGEIQARLDELVSKLSERRRSNCEECGRLTARVAELEAKVADARRCFEIECPCCGQLAATWAVSDGDSLECGCDGQISCCSETYPYANADGCECGGDGYPKPDERKGGE